MTDVSSMLNKMNITQAEHLPVVAEFYQSIGLAGVVNAGVATEMAVDVDTVAQFMVLDTLSGRSPLYRLERFARSLDTGLVLGKKIPAGAFNNTTLGRTLDAIYDVGTEQLFSQVAFRAANGFPQGYGYAACTLRHHLAERMGGLPHVHQRGGPASNDQRTQQGSTDLILDSSW